MVRVAPAVPASALLWDKEPIAGTGFGGGKVTAIPPPPQPERNIVERNSRGAARKYLEHVQASAVRNMVTDLIVRGERSG
jgi:hypothetical protein